jgi:hypothetical protein
MAVAVAALVGCGGGSGTPADGAAGASGAAGTGAAGTGSGGTGAAGTGAAGTGAAGTGAAGTGAAGTGAAGTGAAGAAADGGAGTTSDAAVDTSASDATIEAGTDTASDGAADAGPTVGGTVNVTEISVNGVAKADFTCVMKGSTFQYTASGVAGTISVGCNNGLQANNLIAVGFGAVAMVGTQTEATTGTAATLQAYTTILNSLGLGATRTTPRHTIKLTSWNAATAHAVGTVEATWDMPAGTGNYGTYKASFDVILKK